tara:strand:- start:24892 stop:25260 length:369 start_codon:yes stop_codon:yes gene_type:complete
MLKKSTYTLLTLVIFVLITGMTISAHYCGSNVKDVSFLSATQSCCENPEGCCHYEACTIKIGNDFLISSYSFDFTQLKVVLPILIELTKVEDPIKVKVYSLRNTIPPPKIQTILSSLQTYLL